MEEHPGQNNQYIPERRIAMITVAHKGISFLIKQGYLNDHPVLGSARPHIVTAIFF
jgi:hypothetical protein